MAQLVSKVHTAHVHVGFGTRVGLRVFTRVPSPDSASLINMQPDLVQISPGWLYRSTLI